MKKKDGGVRLELLVEERGRPSLVGNVQRGKREENGMAVIGERHGADRIAY